jgi:hypothetical protein
MRELASRVLVDQTVGILSESNSVKYSLWSAWHHLSNQGYNITLNLLVWISCQITLRPLSRAGTVRYLREIIADPPKVENIATNLVPVFDVYAEPVFCTTSYSVPATISRHSISIVNGDTSIYHITYDSVYLTLACIYVIG